MEHQMKVSPVVVRRLRIERGWSQEQLADVSGLSLRTIQRIESGHVASLNTSVSLAATFDVNLLCLQNETNEPAYYKLLLRYASLVLGLVILTLMGISESGRVMTGPQSDYFAMVNVFGVAIGLSLIIPPIFLALKYKEVFCALLLMIGTPLATLFLGGLLYWVVNGTALSFVLAVFGLSGAALIVLAIKEMKQLNIAHNA